IPATISLSTRMGNGLRRIRSRRTRQCGAWTARWISGTRRSWRRRWSKRPRMIRSARRTRRRWAIFILHAWIRRRLMRTQRNGLSRSWSGLRRSNPSRKLRRKWRTCTGRYRVRGRAEITRRMRRCWDIRGSRVMWTLAQCGDDRPRRDGTTGAEFLSGSGRQSEGDSREVRAARNEHFRAGGREAGAGEERCDDGAGDRNGIGEGSDGSGGTARSEESEQPDDIGGDKGADAVVRLGHVPEAGEVSGDAAVHRELAGLFQEPGNDAEGAHAGGMEDVPAVADAARKRQRAERGVREGEFRFLREDAGWRARDGTALAAVRAERGWEFGGSAGGSVREASVSGGEQGARAEDGEGYRGGALEGHRCGGMDDAGNEEAGAVEAESGAQQDWVPGQLEGLLFGSSGA